MLTELEAAILTEISMRGNSTAYQVRRAFENSRSAYWRGGAGTVSPAIHRLTRSGHIESRPHPSRSGKILNVTASGTAALNAWAIDIERACGLGLDPFRLRSGVWESLDRKSRQGLLGRLREHLANERDAIAGISSTDPVDRRQNQLALGLIESRIAWIDQTLND